MVEFNKDHQDEHTFNKMINTVSKDQLIKFTCQIFNRRDSKMKPFASGLLIKTKSQKFIISASHVFEDFELNDEDLFIRIAETKYINIIGQYWLTDLKNDEKADLAIIKATDETVDSLELSHTFLPISKLEDHTIIENALNYSVMGFPAMYFKNESVVVFKAPAPK